MWTEQHTQFCSRCMITINAMGTQSEIADQIVERGADYQLLLFDWRSRLSQAQPPIRFG